MPGVGQRVVGRDRQHHRAGVAQMGLDRHGHAGVGDAVGQLAQRVAGAGGDQQHIQQLLGTDRFGLGDGVPDFVAADALDLLAEIRGLAKAGVGFIGVGGEDGG